MKIKKLILWLSGAISMICIPLGICVSVCPKIVGIIVGIVLACLSLCFGMITINPLLAFPLALGILMIFFPLPCGIILACFGLGGVIAVPIVANKILKRKNA